MDGYDGNGGHNLLGVHGRFQSHGLWAGNPHGRIQDAISKKKNNNKFLAVFLHAI